MKPFARATGGDSCDVDREQLLEVVRRVRKYVALPHEPTIERLPISSQRWVNVC